MFKLTRAAPQGEYTLLEEPQPTSAFGRMIADAPCVITSPSRVRPELDVVTLKKYVTELTGDNACAIFSPSCISVTPFAGLAELCARYTAEAPPMWIFVEQRDIAIPLTSAIKTEPGRDAGSAPDPYHEPNPRNWNKYFVTGVYLVPQRVVDALMRMLQDVTMTERGYNNLGDLLGSWTAPLEELQCISLRVRLFIAPMIEMLMKRASNEETQLTAHQIRDQAYTDARLALYFKEFPAIGCDPIEAAKRLTRDNSDQGAPSRPARRYVEIF